MHIQRRTRIVLPLLVATAVAFPATAQQQAAPTTTATPATPAAPAASAPAKKPAPKPKPAAAAPAAPAAAAKPATPPAAGGVKPTLLGQYGDWGAYTASPAGKKLCFAIARPASAETNPPNRPRNPIFMFISTRPADKVTNEVSIIVGYPFKPGTEASVAVGSTSYALYTQQDGAWIKNATEEAQMVDAMRQGQTTVVKGMSAKGTQSTDTFSLKGLAQALDRTGQDCK
jgi:Invasion associated locus B (IalB) protein